MNRMKNKDVIKGALALAVLLIAIILVAKPYTPEDAGDPPGMDLVACTMDAKQCPDGSYVGRVSPFCEFAECPALNSAERDMLTDVTVIRYNKYGFSPKTITVKAGTRVGFQNTSNREFWPTSEIFDAEVGIAPGNKFLYTFDTPGTWTYFNSLNNEETGTVVVK